MSVTEEMLNEVLGGHIEYSHIKITKDFIQYVTPSNYSPLRMDIYRFAHECKKYAFSKGYVLESAYIFKGEFTSSYCIVMQYAMARDNHNNFPVHADTEPEAIFKATSYVIEQIKKEQK